MIEQLRRVQLSWDLSLDDLAKLSHVSPATLQKYLALPASEAEALATVPAGLENAMPLLSIFQSLQSLRPRLEDQLEWLRALNPVLEDQAPLQVMMMSPSHLSWVSYTLASALREKNP